MNVTIEYGSEKLILRLPDDIELDDFSHKAIDKNVDIRQFENILSEVQDNLFDICETELFIVNDAYRPTPTSVILEWLYSLGKLSDKSKFIVATGVHQAPSKNQLLDIFGGLYNAIKERILIHDASDFDSMVEIGRDSFGEAVFVNRAFIEAEKITVIGSVEPHYFAGFTGGRKSIFPGLCNFETTARNHNLAVSFEAMPMRLNGNPVEEHLQSLMKIIADKKLLSMQIVPSYEKSDRFTLFCGNLEESFRQAKELSEYTYGIKIQKEYDLLLAETRPPLDSNLYQLQKSLENCQKAVADGGTVILFSPCREGIGSENFYSLAEHWDSNLLENMSDAEAFGMHKLHRVEKMANRLNVNLYSELDEGVSDRVFFRTIKNPQLLINNILEGKKKAKVALVRDAGHTAFVN